MTRKIIDPYGPMDFTGGQKVKVIRGEPKTNRYGEIVAPAPSHEVGPCAVKHTEAEYRRDGEGPRDNATYTVSAPTGSDIREGDQVELADGTVGVLKAAPKQPKNPFTGWEPFTQFILQAD